MKKRSFTLLMSALTISATLIGTSPVAAKTDTDTATEETTDKEETTAKDADSENTDNKETDASKSDTLEDGTYTAEFDTDSGMFHVNEANDGKGTLTVKDGKMTIHVSLASKKIVNLFVGKAEDALSTIEYKPYRERQKRIVYPPKESNRDRLCSVIDSILAEKPKDYEDFLHAKEWRRAWKFILSILQSARHLLKIFCACRGSINLSSRPVSKYAFSFFGLNDFKIATRNLGIGIIRFEFVVFGGVMMIFVLEFLSSHCTLCIVLLILTMPLNKSISLHFIAQSSPHLIPVYSAKSMASLVKSIFFVR